jgi:photosystem II stability/assembly factor-like uncharacterized protein
VSHSYRFPRFLAIVSACIIGFVFALPLSAQQLKPSLYSGMRWRLIGPYRAGRVTSVAGIPGNPATFYMGTPGGGVWKTTDGGTVWHPIFDSAHVASIGAVALAPSNPNIIYVGTGEQTEGDGVWKSTDAGETWTHVGLDDTHFINSVIVDPKNPDQVLVGAMGDSFSSQARGVYKTTDGGKTWNKVLFKDDMTGVADMCLDPGNSRVVYAALWRPQIRVFFPPSGGSNPGPDAWIYRSTDGGSTWKPIEGHGLPSEKWGRTGIAVAPGNHGKRIFAILDQGLFRSDDHGANWRQMGKDPRVVGNGYFSRVFVDPRNADIVYVVQTSLYRSTDGGEHFVAYKGSPGGDDYHVMWIDPDNSQRMILGVDQGATISVDGGATWTPWYNQPTGQFYHVTTGSGFPYYAYGQQQDSGSAAVPNRSSYGEISYRDWFSPGGYEFGYMAADPMDTEINYAGNEGGSVARFDHRTAELTFLFVHGREYRTSSNAPMEFAPQDPQALYFGTQYVMKTTDAGENWHAISPDLTDRSDSSASGPGGEARRRDVITTLSLSAVASGEIWVGTSDGLIQLSTDDGATWKNVSPPDLDPRSLVSIMEASRFDAGAAYAAVDAFQNSRPYFYRTSDFGKTWTKIIDGLPSFGIARVIREDTERKGLLYAGTETGVFVSFDNGEHWQSLQLNLPTASVRDLAVHGNDLVAATFGRALWILDDVSPLRQADDLVANSNVHFFTPEEAVRVRWDEDQDTPLPPEVPAGQNPPDGAIIDYYLQSAPSDAISLEIDDSQGKLVRKFSSVAPSPETILTNVPDYWFAPATSLPKDSGMNRFVWNLRYEHPLTLPSEISSDRGDYNVFSEVHHAIIGQTPRDYPLGPQVLPGQYHLVLTVGGQSYRQPLTVKMDPRIHTSEADLALQLGLEEKLVRGMASSFELFHQSANLHEELSERLKSLASNARARDAANAAEEFEKRLAAIENGSFVSPGFEAINHSMASLLYMTESSASRPSESLGATVGEACEALSNDIANWRKLNADELAALNGLLAKYNLSALPVAPTGRSDSGCGE